MLLDYIMSLHVCVYVSNSDFKYGCINWNICNFYEMIWDFLLKLGPYRE